MARSAGFLVLPANAHIAVLPAALLTGQPGEHLLRCYALALSLRRITCACISQESRVLGLG
eukprot:6270587-Alexandrium_andersonii.AAC.1